MVKKSGGVKVWHDEWKLWNFKILGEILKSIDFFQKSRFRFPIYWNFNEIAALRAMFRFIGDAGARALCHVYTYDVFTFHGVSGVVVCGSCLDIITMACRDGFRSRRIVSSNTALAPSGNLGQAWPVPINIFGHIFDHSSGFHRWIWLSSRQNLPKVIRFHILNRSCSRKFIGRSLNGL